MRTLSSSVPISTPTATTVGPQMLLRIGFQIIRKNGARKLSTKVDMNIHR